MRHDIKLELENTLILSSRQLILLRDIASLSASLQMPAYLVGGFVRDLLLGQSINDLDVVVEGNAIQLGESLVKKIGGKLTPHPKFHTAIWHIPSSHRQVQGDALDLQPSTLDLITARSETYHHPGALPTVKPSVINDDLRRRDFTINAMAVRLDGDHFGELLDPLNGQTDLEQKIIRVLHPRSFIDDPTRIFRAIRYAVRYAFTLHPLSLTLINPESLAVLQTLSGERIRHELDLIFEEDNSYQMILRLADLGLFKLIHPEIPMFNANYSDFLEMDTRLEVPASRPTMGYMLWLMDLSEAAILSIARRLSFTSSLTHSVWGASQLKKGLPFLVNSSPSIWVSAVEKLPLLSIYVVYLVTGEKALLDYLSFWRHVKPHTSGDDLKARGLAPGPRFGDILTKLRAAWLDGQVKSTKEEVELLNKLL
jgi:tRNA nucleotidyltransferase (CCA-adding enzyme)